MMLGQKSSGKLSSGCQGPDVRISEESRRADDAERLYGEGVEEPNLNEAVFVQFLNDDPTIPHVGPVGADLYKIASIELQPYLPAHRASSSVITGW